jgi:hypothetical protein
MVPFFNRVASTVRSVRNDWLILAEVDLFAAMRGATMPPGCPERTVNASHWSDLATLVTKRFDPVSAVAVLIGRIRPGPFAIEQGYTDGLTRIRSIGDSLNGGAPTLVGEFGIPVDMNDADAYSQWAQGDRGDTVWERQITALQLTYNALDRLLLSSTQWNYTVSNRNDAMIGDGWNQEDLSIWSADQGDDAPDLDVGGRAIAGFCRPYVQAAQGTLVSQRFDADGRFTAVIDGGASPGATIVFHPHFSPDTHDVTAEGAEFQQHGRYLLFTSRSPKQQMTIEISTKNILS